MAFAASQYQNSSWKRNPVQRDATSGNAKVYDEHHERMEAEAKAKGRGATRNDSETVAEDEERKADGNGLKNGTSDGDGLRRKLKRLLRRSKEEQDDVVR